MSVTEHELRIQAFALAVYRYCVRFRGSVVSGFRTRSRNRDVGGKPDSLHLQGLAADVVLDFNGDDDSRHVAAFDLGLRLVIEHDHDHLEYRR